VLAVGAFCRGCSASNQVSKASKDSSVAKKALPAIRFIVRNVSSFTTPGA
jgi:hypothetical protein